MSVVKSFSVGEGDMFYISHDSDNFTMIDCCLYKKDGVKEPILKEIKQKQAGKGIRRFVSTHPDDDHISGIIDFESEVQINNFCVVQNNTTKDPENADFEKYCELRDGEKVFYLQKGCTRKWMNEKDQVRDHSGLHCLWPITSNEKYIEALNNAAEGKSPNNISPVIQYKIHSFSLLWMGDMESDMQEEFDDNLAVIGDGTFEIHDIPVAAPPLGLRDQVLHALDQRGGENSGHRRGRRARGGNWPKTRQSHRSARARGARRMTPRPPWRRSSPARSLRRVKITQNSAKRFFYFRSCCAPLLHHLLLRDCVEASDLTAGCGLHCCWLHIGSASGLNSK